MAGKARAFTKRDGSAPAIGTVGDKNRHRIPKRGKAPAIGVQPGQNQHRLPKKRAKAAPNLAKGGKV